MVDRDIFYFAIVSLRAIGEVIIYGCVTQYIISVINDYFLFCFTSISETGLEPAGDRIEQGL